MSDVRDDAHGTSVARQLSLHWDKPSGSVRTDVCNNEAAYPGLRCLTAVKSRGIRQNLVNSHQRSRWMSSDLAMSLEL